MSTKLTPSQVKRIQGKCSGCFHIAPGKKELPGASSVCGICIRNVDAHKGASARSDDGKIVYGQRDCFIAFDRFEMELRGETFLKGVEIGGR